MVSTIFVIERRSSVESVQSTKRAPMYRFNYRLRSKDLKKYKSGLGKMEGDDDSVKYLNETRRSYIINMYILLYIKYIICNDKYICVCVCIS